MKNVTLVISDPFTSNLVLARWSRGPEAEVDAEVQQLLSDVAANGEKYATMEIEEAIPVAAAEENF